MIPECDDVSSTEVSSYEHTECESESPCEIILSLKEDSCDSPYEPKYRHRRRCSLRFEGRETEYKSIIEVVPHSGARDKNISEK